MPDAIATQSLAEHFLRDPDRFDAVARQLSAQGNCSVTLAIDGASMAGSLPAGTLVQVALTTGTACRSGDVVLFREGRRIVAHRVRGSVRGYVVTCGDSRMAPDPPVALSRILGRVTGQVTPAGVVPCPPMPRCRWAPRAVNIFWIRMTLWLPRLSPKLARGWVAAMTALERSRGAVSARR